MLTYRIASENDTQKLVRLLKKLDTSFPIPLSQKTNIDSYAEKLMGRGIVYLAFDGDDAVGIVGLYANDMQTKQAYISILGVEDTYRRRGIAKKLLQEAVRICTEKGMTACRLYTHKSNYGAVCLYRGMGFAAAQNTDRPQDLQFVKQLS